MSCFSPALAAFADALFSVGAVKFGAFRLKLHETRPDAPLSPIFLNLRTPENPRPGPLTPELVRMAGQLLFKMTIEHGIRFSRVCGIPRAGEPFANVIAQLSEQPVVRLLKEEKADGTRSIARVDFNNFKTRGAGLDPEMWPGEEILLVDDLITGADTKLEAIQTLRRETIFDVRELVVLVDRQQGGVETLAHANVRVHALMTLSGLLAYYLSTSRIDQSTYDRVKDYIRQPRS